MKHPHQIFPQTPGSFTTEERRQLLDLARRTLREVVATGRQPEVDTGDMPRKFFEPRGCFVTLTMNGALRGCIGSLRPDGPLFREIMWNTENAATRDPRFPPVCASEVDEIEIEISVLTEPKPLTFDSPDDLLARLRPGEDGVVLRIGNHMATYLPKVWNDIPDKDAFLRSLAMKAGYDAMAWRGPGAAVSIYQAECFKESEFQGASWLSVETGVGHSKPV
jgi:AmmeMemoRadiSam system protein A